VGRLRDARLIAPAEGCPMIVSYGRSYVYVHIPKTGGTSLSLALEQRAKRDDLLIGDTPKAKRRKRRLEGVETRGRLWKHATLADIDGLMDEAVLQQMFVFTMVRNPWDRVVSYYHWLRSQSFSHPVVYLARSLSFAEFLYHDSVQTAFRTSPATSYLRDAQGRDRGDLFIRLEHFKEDARPLETHLGFDIDLPHVNASARARDYRSYYDADLAAIVRDVCAEDISRFGYWFDPVE
jgi:hypothetical protein